MTSDSLFSVVSFSRRLLDSLACRLLVYIVSLCFPRSPSNQLHLYCILSDNVLAIYYFYRLRAPCASREMIPAYLPLSYSLSCPLIFPLLICDLRSASHSPDIQ